MLNKDNYVCGRPPIFGDPEQIAFLKKKHEQLEGIRPFDRIELVFRKEDGVSRCKFTCPVCKVINEVGVGHGWPELQDMVIDEQIDYMKDLRKEGVECWSMDCIASFRIDDKNFIYIQP